MSRRRWTAGSGSPASARASWGCFDPKTGNLEKIPLGPGAAPHGVVVGPDGAAWVTDGGQNAMARVDAATKAVKLFPLPKDFASANLNTPTIDGKGVVWFTGQSGVYGRVDPADRQGRCLGVAQGPRALRHGTTTRRATSGTHRSPATTSPRSTRRPAR